MTDRTLTITYREGKAFAAYLYLSGRRSGEKSSRTVAFDDGLLIVDYAADGRAIGIEMPAPYTVPLARLNALLAELGEKPLPARDYAPLRAA